MIEKIILAVTLLFTGGITADKKSVDIDKGDSKEVLNSKKGVVNKLKSINNVTLKTNWDDEYQENGYESFDSVIETRDGGFVAVGETTILEDGSLGDAFIIKYNKDGLIEWQEALLGEDTDMYFNLAEDEDGSIYVIGKSFSSDLNFSNTLNQPHALLVKYSSDGTQEWITTYNDGGRQINYNDLIVSNDKLIIVGNKINNSSRTGFVRIVNKSDGTENKIVYLQDNDYDTNIKSIIKSNDNSYVVVGNTINKTTSEEFPLIVKLDSSGNTLWSYELSQNISISKEGSFNSVIETSDSSFVVGGFVTESNKTNPILMKFSNSGTLMWSDIEDNDYAEVCKSVLINNQNEIIASYEKTPNENVSLKDNLEINIKRYDLDGNLIDVNLLGKDTNIRHTSTIITSEDKLVLVGRRYVDVEIVDGNTSTCETRNITSPEVCLQSNAFITMFEFFDACAVNDLPVINIDNKNVVINKGDIFNVMDGVTATDEGVSIADKVVATPSTIDTSVKGSHEITYKVSDECGETVIKRTVTIEDPCDINNLPVINLDNENVTINKGDIFNVMDGVTATDEGVNITNKVVAIPSTIDTSIKGNHEITYKVSDECGETVIKRTITIEDPCDINNLPVINVDNKNVIINKGYTFNVMDGITATDDGANITNKVVATPSTIDTSVKGSHEITYKVSDECGETVIKRTITIEDPCDINNLPIIIVEKEEVVLEANSIFDVMSGVTATDEGIDVSDKIIATPSNIDTSKEGTYDVVYKVSDDCGEVEKRIQVIVKQNPCEINEPPVIEIDDIVLELNSEFNPLNGIIATDKEKGDITDRVTIIKNDVDTTKVGIYEVEYQVADDCGLVANKKILVTVELDPCEINEMPVINAEDKEIILGSEFNPMDGVTAVDKEDKDITFKIEIIKNTVEKDKIGEYEIVYKVSDECNEVEKAVKVKVKDKLPVVDSVVDENEENIIDEEESEIETNTVKPQTGDNMLMYIVLGGISIVAIILLNKKKK